MNDSESNSELCQRCGERLAKSAGQVVCPRCMMRLAIHPSPSEVAAPELDVTQSVMLNARATSDNNFPDLMPGQAFGDYRIIQRLGHGGMGVVYEADHVPTTRRVALKVMGHSLDDRDSRARFLREGRLAASINHPHSVYVYGTEEIEERPTISMELVCGGTLGQQVKTDGPFSSKAAVDTILQIVDGMEAANDAGVLHRDIKPNNCFVDADGQVKVGDYGLSITAVGRDLPAGPGLARTQTEITQVGTFLGTPAYASPEQLRGEPLDLRSDIYSIGVTLYYLLTGEVPFVADNMIQLLARVLDNPAPALKDVASGAPEELDRVIAKCLKKAPGDRFASYAELRAALLPHSSHTPTPASLGNRALAAAIDYGLLTLAISPLSIWLLAIQSPVNRGDPLPGISSVMASALAVVIQCSYFAITEWRYGKTLGKRMLGLQVVQGDRRPSLAAATTRSLLFVVPAVLPGIVFGSLYTDWQYREVTSIGLALFFLLVGWSRFLIPAAMFLTVRANNGNAAVHDLLTGTRVVENLTITSRKPSVYVRDAFDAKSGTEMIGPYHVLRPLGSTDQGDLLLGYDATLLRRVWLHVRPNGTPCPPHFHCNSPNQSRLRWLGGNVESQKHWDAYEALSGWPVTDNDQLAFDWSAAKDVIGQLGDELYDDSRVAEFAENFSLQHLWVTESGQLKLLPFAVLGERTDGESDHSGSLNRPAGEDAMDAQHVGVLRDLAKLFAERYRPTKQGSQAIPLSDLTLLQRLAGSTSLASAADVSDALRNRRPIRVSYRIAGLIVATLLLPMFTIISSLMMTVVYDQQEKSMPEVRELAGILIMIDKEFHSDRRDNTLNVNALKTYARANYRGVMEDEKMMYSIYGQTLLTAHRQKLNEIFNQPAPTALEAEKAASQVAEIRKLHGKLSRLENQFIGLHGGIFWATLTWIELIWIPSLLTALIFRGGLLIRLFGLTIVNSRGKHASRLRVFVRMFASGIVPVCVFALFWALPARWPSEWPIETVQRFVAASVIVIACLAVVIYRSRLRFFSDLLAGTYLAAR